MLTKFSRLARQALATAQHEAHDDGSLLIEPHHLLAGLALLPPEISAAAHVLNGHGVSGVKLRALRPAHPQDSTHLDLSMALKRVLEAAATIALRRTDSEIGSAHLLAALCTITADDLLWERLGAAPTRLGEALDSLAIWRDD